LLVAAERLAGPEGPPEALGLIAMVRGVAAFMAGRWAEGRDGCDGAEAILRERCTGVAWELDTARTFALWSLAQMGQFAELGRRRPALMRDARERGDRYAAACLGPAIGCLVHLAADDRPAARREIRTALDQCLRRGGDRGPRSIAYPIALYWIYYSKLNLYLYDGCDRPRLVRLCSLAIRALRAHHLDRVQIVRADVRRLRAECALAVASRAAARGPWLRSAARDARRLEREGMPWTLAHARLIRAGIAAARGEAAGAATLLAEAIGRFEAVAMPLHAAAARRRLGGLLGGDAGRALIAAADAWMAGQQIRDPARMTALYAPGFPD
jgi:hypothetical protein